MTAGTSTEWVSARPAPALRPFIDDYIGYRMTGFGAGLHRGLPSRHMTFIVSIGSPIDVVAQTSSTQAPATYRCVLSGLQATSALIAHDGNQEGVAIELTPLGARTLFAMPAREFWDLSLELSEVAGPVGVELWERLQVAVGWRARFAACDDVLERLAANSPVAPELAHCWQTLVATGGTIAIGELASEVGYSRQHLTRRFRDEFGLSPKLAGRVMRFERAKQMLTSTPSFVTIGQIAAACGYADHAHLDRDFAQLAGCTPSELVAGDVPIVQDGNQLEPSH